MELPEGLDYINNLLKEHFGIDTDTSKPIWRVVWSDSQYEHRLGTYDDYSPGGIYLRTITEVRETRKYTWINNKYVLERLVVIPDQNLKELPATKKSYEPLWVFEDAKGNYLPPLFRACKLIVDSVYAAIYSTSNLARYKKSSEETEKETKDRVDGYVNELFGDESGLMQSTLGGGNAIIVPSTYERSK